MAVAAETAHLKTLFEWNRLDVFSLPAMSTNPPADAGVAR